MDKTNPSYRPRLALLIDESESEFQARLLKATAEAARLNGMDFLGVVGGVLGLEHSYQESFVYELISQESVDAILIATHVLGHHSTLSEVQSFVDRYAPMPRIGLGVELEGIPSLLIDNEAGMHAVVEHLTSVHDYRRIAFVTGPAASQEADARYQGYRRALGGAGLVEDLGLVVRGDFLRESGARAVQVLFGQRGLRPDEVDAIVCADDAMALGVLDALTERGLRVPRDIALSGFDDIEFGRYARAPLTTVRQPIVEQVNCAVRMLAKALAGSPLETGTITFETEFVARRSCGCTLRQREATPSWSSLGERRDVGTALRARWSKVVADLRGASHGGLEGVPEGWEDRLLGGLLSQITGKSPDALLEAVDDMLDAVLQRRGEVGACQDALIALRRHAMACAPDPDVRARLDDILQEGLLRASDLSATSQALRREEALETRKALGDVTTALLAAPDLSSLSETAANHVPKLRIQSFMLALFTESNRVTPELNGLLLFTGRGRSSFPARFPTAHLAPDGFLNGRDLILAPLGFQGERLGIALFEYGQFDSLLFGELQRAISASVKGALLMRDLEEAKRIVETLAITDPLTGLFNRRHLSTRLRQEQVRAQRHQRPLSVIMLDLDGFKRVNDLYGHDEGDQVLRRTARALVDNVRVIDTVARVGGDEFVVVLPEAPQDQASLVASRILEAMKNTELHEFGAVSASIGISTVMFDNESASPEEMIRQADHAMLRAKRAGKNRVLHFLDCAKSEPPSSRATRGE